MKYYHVATLHGANKPDPVIAMPDEVDVLSVTGDGGFNGTLWVSYTWPFESPAEIRVVGK